MSNKKTTKLSLALITVLALSQNTFANDADTIKTLQKEITELRQLTQEIQETQQVLIDEKSNEQLGFTTVDSEKGYLGMGPAASKVYYANSPLSFGGYGKVDYYHKTNEGKENSDNIDVYRFIGYIGYKFTDNIILNTEIEFEHGGAEDGATGKDGYVIIEFLYLDFLMNKNYNLRVGNMLMPMGLINQHHEPTLFTTVQRPNTSKLLIPSTWHENGVMAYGQITDDLSYNFGAFSALKLDRGLEKGDKWLRKSRVGSFRLNSDERLHFAAVGRIDYTGVNGLYAGASAYIDSNLVMTDVHFDYSQDAFRAYGVYTQTNRSKTRVDEPEKAQGGFVNLSYNISSFVKQDAKIPVFFQYETVSAQDEITGGTGKDSTDSITIGINYFPTEQVVLKVDYAMHTNNSKADNANETDVFSLSMGFIF